MEKPLAEKDLVEAILELRAEADRRLMRNKYYVAIKKLDELLEAIRPLEEAEDRATDQAARRGADAVEPVSPVYETPVQAPPVYQAPVQETPVSVAEEAYPEAAGEPPGVFAATGDEAGYAQEVDEPAAELFEDPPYEPVRTEREVSVLDVPDEPPADSLSAAGPIRQRADAAE